MQLNGIFKSNIMNLERYNYLSLLYISYNYGSNRKNDTFFYQIFIHFTHVKFGVIQWVVLIDFSKIN